jgi:uncharacterized protein YlxP (DUF503 family)
MFFALCRFTVFIPEGRSLKGKRSVVAGLKERLRARFHAAVIEVEDQDRVQRGTLALALVGRQPAALEEALAAMRRLVDQEPRCMVTDWQTRVEPFEGAPGAPRQWSADAPDPAREWDEIEQDDELYGPQWDARRSRADDASGRD